MFKNLSIKDFVFVSAQTVLFGLYAFPLLRTPCIGELPLVIYLTLLSLAVTGVLIVVTSMLQMRTSISPFPSPKDHATLVVNGMYTYVRHPIYSGVLLSAYSWALVSDSAWRLGVSIALHTLFYFKSHYEERLLSQRYALYADYSSSVGRFVPRLS